jgi:hypothetical protein
VSAGGEGAAAAAPPLRLGAPPWRLVVAAIGGPRAVAEKAARLARTVRLWFDRAEIRLLLWPGGTDPLLARTHWHAAWIHWL